MKIAFHKADIKKEEINAVIDTLKSGWLTAGPKVIEFENEVLKYIPSKFAFLVNSATSALHLALKAIGIKEDDEVIVPTNTFIATAEVITYFKARPVLCDIEYSTGNIDVSKVEKLITNKTKAIIPVHFSGVPCDMDELIDIANKYKLKLIEDAAHSLPSTYKGRQIGSISDITCFSFYATKTLCMGEGGMAITNNEEYANSIRVNRLHGISKDAWDRYSFDANWYYEVVDNGFKYNSTDINASLGLAGLKKLFVNRDKRRLIAKAYNDAFKDKIEFLDLKEDRESSYHLYVIKVNNRDELINLLKEEGISSSVHFIPVHKHPYYKKTYSYKQEDYKEANRFFSKCLSLPIYPDLTKEELQYIITKVLNYAK